MQSREIGPIDRFEVESEDGTIETVYVYQQQINATEMHGPEKWVDGLRVLRTFNGEEVSMLRDGGGELFLLRGNQVRKRRL